MENRIYPILYPADIGAIRGSGPLRWFSQRLITPKTDRVHFFLIGDYLPWDNDYVILESIGKGIAVGRLSFYKPEDVEIYRVVLSETPEQRLGNRKLEEIHEVRQRAAAELTRVGRARYDYLLIIKLALGGLALLLSGHLPPWEAKDFKWGRNSRFLCTEACQEAWLRVAHPIVPEGICPFPSEFKRALQNGRLFRIYPRDRV